MSDKISNAQRAQMIIESQTKNFFGLSTDECFDAGFDYVQCDYIRNALHQKITPAYDAQIISKEFMSALTGECGVKLLKAAARWNEDYILESFPHWKGTLYIPRHADI